MNDGDQIVFEGFDLFADIAVCKSLGKANIAALDIAVNSVGIIAAALLAIQAGRGRPCSGGRAVGVIAAGGGDRVCRVDGRASAGVGVIRGNATVVW